MELKTSDYATIRELFVKCKECPYRWKCITNRHSSQPTKLNGVTSQFGNVCAFCKHSKFETTKDTQANKLHRDMTGVCNKHGYLTHAFGTCDEFMPDPYKWSTASIDIVSTYTKELTMVKTARWRKYCVNYEKTEEQFD